MIKGHDWRCLIDQNVFMANQRVSPANNEAGGKDRFYDRKRMVFGPSYDACVIAVAILTWCAVPGEIFRRLRRGNYFGIATTHVAKLHARFGRRGSCFAVNYGGWGSAYAAN
jgi:hypothetical protein